MRKLSIKKNILGAKRRAPAPKEYYTYRRKDGMRKCLTRGCTIGVQEKGSRCKICVRRVKYGCYVDDENVWFLKRHIRGIRHFKVSGHADILYWRLQCATKGCTSLYTYYRDHGTQRKHCKTHTRRNLKNGAFESIFKIAKANAERRGILWELTYLQYLDICQKTPNCVYCRTPVNRISHYKTRKRNTTGHKLDRIDSYKGYTINNVVTCCQLCNATKMGYMTPQEMFVIASMRKGNLSRAKYFLHLQKAPKGFMQKSWHKKDAQIRNARDKIFETRKKQLQISAAKMRSFKATLQ